MSVTTPIHTTLAERGSRYGVYTGHAQITQAIKGAMQFSPTSKWNELSDDQKETLDMIAHKIGRILNGDPNYHDSWHDIIGYATLTADEILRKQTPVVVTVPNGIKTRK